MMKKMIALMLSVVLALSLFVGCSDAKKEETDNKGKETKAAEMQGEEVTIDKITVTVPEGWKAIPNEMNKGAVYVIKGGEDPMENPYIHIVAGVTQLPPKEGYDEVVDEKPMELDNFTWNGFSGDSFGYPITVLGAEQEDGTFIQLEMFKDIEGKTYNIDDADVQFIVGSIKVAK